MTRKHFCLSACLLKHFVHTNLLYLCCFFSLQVIIITPGTMTIVMVNDGNDNNDEKITARRSYQKLSQNQCCRCFGSVSQNIINSVTVIQSMSVSLVVTGECSAPRSPDTQI